MPIIPAEGRESLPAGTALFGAAAAPDVHVMSFNVRRASAGPPARLSRRADRWSIRQPVLDAFLRLEQPTLLAVQEVMPLQTEAISKALGERYRWIGRGRDADGNGEAALFFYDSTRFRLDAWEQRALSATPGVPGSRSFGNLLPRVVVSAEVTDAATGARLTVHATHLDHLSRRSRVESARLIAGLTHADSRPSIVLGDANVGIPSDPFRAFTASGLRDSWSTAERRATPEWGTFSNYREPRRGARRIDWIMVSPGIEVRAAAINPFRMGGVAASDHEPVQAMVRIAKGGNE